MACSHAEEMQWDTRFLPHMAGSLKKNSFIDFRKKRGQGREGAEEYQFIVPLICAFIGCFLYAS